MKYSNGISPVGAYHLASLTADGRLPFSAREPIARSAAVAVSYGPDYSGGKMFAMMIARPPARVCMPR